MATLLAHITVKAGAEERFEAVIRDLYARTHADEDAVARYEYWRGEERGTYYSLLSFVDHRAFIVHQTSDHHEVASPEIGALVASIRLEWVDPIAGASELPPTENQVPLDDADDLTVTYAQRFAARVADWWLALR